MMSFILVSKLMLGLGILGAPAQSAVQPPQESAMQAILSEDLIRSLRDPFQVPAILQAKKAQPRTELETFQIKDLKLNGVITGPKKVRAMVTAPNNKTYFVKVGDLLGAREGRVSKINPDSIQIMEYEVDERGKRLPDEYKINMSGEIISLNKNRGE